MVLKHVNQLLDPKIENRSLAPKQDIVVAIRVA
jgi:hypothetical protein